MDVYNIPEEENVKILDEPITSEYPNLEEYLGVLENEAWNAYYDLDLSASPSIILNPNGRGTYPADEMPRITGDYHSDGEKFWFEPRMQFPEFVKWNDYRGSYAGHLRHWEEAGKLADYLLEHEWYIETEE